MNKLNNIFLDPGCYWITGLSASGKTTIATKLTSLIRDQNLPVVQLDGDELRSVFKDSAYTKQERYLLAQKYSKLCQLIVNNEINVVIGVIGMFHEIHDWNRKNISNYKEIFLNTPMDELKRRDPKNIYKKAEKGEIKNVAGLDMGVEFPIKPDVQIDWKNFQTEDETFHEITKALQS